MDGQTGDFLGDLISDLGYADELMVDMYIPFGVMRIEYPALSARERSLLIAHEFQRFIWSFHDLAVNNGWQLK